MFKVEAVSISSRSPKELIFSPFPQEEFFFNMSTIVDNIAIFIVDILIQFAGVFLILPGHEFAGPCSIYCCGPSG